MGGRPKKPTALKKLRGEKRSWRLNENEPQPLQAIERIPENLTELQKYYYSYYFDVLNRMRVLTEADIKQLEIYCKACAEEDIFEKIARDANYFVDTFKVDGLGNEIREVKAHPAMIRAEKAREIINKFSMTLGLSPVARTKLQVIDKGEGNPFETFMNGKD